VRSGRISPIFRQNMLTPSSDPKNKTSEKKESNRAAVGLLFNSDEGGIMSSQTTRPYGVMFLKSCMILLLRASDIIVLGEVKCSVSWTMHLVPKMWIFLHWFICMQVRRCKLGITKTWNKEL
jgi:hypothetical protein